MATYSVDEIGMFLKEKVFEYHLVFGKLFVGLECLVDGFQHQIHPVPVVVLVSNFGKQPFEVLCLKIYHHISHRHHFQCMKAENGYEVVQLTYVKLENVKIRVS